ncbi:class IIb bacteriocin, lactobin A/cerein 7B family [Flavobacterium flavigenum]|uniref:class IIb bacteriocin, lactobin A/cerein 7B family n=1 Tax=Flavobacterium flavigenum TaxID=3003258 RepID=UPI0022AC3907|nr:class IIb bacteriocin, lactobin A/cerein 7B family [Flavobacterium flavigenum]
MKTTIEQQEKGAELVKVLAQKAWESTAFKEQLIKDPIAAIEQVTGKALLPSDKRIVVEDQTDESVIYFNIPAKINLDELELTEEQLEMLAGGILPVVAYAIGAGIGFGLCWLGSHV